MKIGGDIPDDVEVTINVFLGLDDLIDKLETEITQDLLMAEICLQRYYKATLESNKLYELLAP